MISTRRILAMALSAATATATLAQGITVSPDDLRLRGAEIGRMHGTALVYLLDSGWRPSLPLDGSEYDAALQAAAEAGGTDRVVRALEGAGLTPRHAREMAGLIVQATLARVAELARTSGAVSSGNVKGHVTPDAMELAMLDEMADRNLISRGLVGAMSDLFDAAAASRTRGDLEADARRLLGGHRWQGWDRVAADATLSVLQQSLGFWEQVARDRCDATDTGDETQWVLHGSARDAAATDAVGAAVGAVIGAIGAAGALLTVAALQPELAPAVVAAGPKAVAAGAAAGGAATAAVGSAIASALPSEDETPDEPREDPDPPASDGEAGTCDNG